MNLLKNKMGMRVLTLALCAALGGSVLAVKAEAWRAKWSYRKLCRTKT